VHSDPCFLTGSVFAALAAYAAPWKIEGVATEFVRTGDQGATFRFRFCPVCGSQCSTLRKATTPS